MPTEPLPVPTESQQPMHTEPLPTNIEPPRVTSEPPRLNAETEPAAIRRELAELIRSVRLISQKVEWLMDNALIIADAPIWDLDGSVDEDMARLAAKVERGERFQDQLLDTSARKELKLAVDRHWEWGRKLEQRQTGVLALSEAIVGPDESAAARAAEEFPAAWQAVTELEQDGPQLEAAARVARERLDADDEARSRHGRDIEAVGHAWDELCHQLRELIDTGVSQHALFPAWFRDSLGLAPPPDAPTRWFELATEILAYRVTYRVTSEASPLGDPPPGDASSRRREWHQRLRAGLSRLT
jgi:hypothetical protein